MQVAYSGTTDIGFQRTVNEDFMMVREIGDIILSIVADGAGSTGTTFQPATMAAVEVADVVERQYSENPERFKDNLEVILSEAMRTASRVLAAFQTANEELYNGYAASMACCVLMPKENSMVFANVGNTRINMMRRNPKTNEYSIKQFTKDQTAGQALLDEGKCTFEEYHLRPERLQLTGGLGIVANPEIQTFTLPMRNGDFVLMTTDGIHYAIRPDAFFDILSASKDCEECVQSMVVAAKELEYADNMSAVLFWLMDEGGAQ